MILLLLGIGLLVFMFKMIILAGKLTWGLTKGILTIGFLPLIVIGMIIFGLVRLALPLVVVGIIIAFLIPVFKR